MRSHRTGDYRVRIEQETFELRHRLLPLQRPQHHYLLPEFGQKASVLRDHQVVRYARTIQVSHVFRFAEKTLWLTI